MFLPFHPLSEDTLHQNIFQPWPHPPNKIIIINLQVRRLRNIWLVCYKIQLLLEKLSETNINSVCAISRNFYNVQKSAQLCINQFIVQSKFFFVKLYNSEVNIFCNIKNLMKLEFKNSYVLLPNQLILPLINILLFFLQKII